MNLGVQIEPQFGFSYDRIRDIARSAHAGGFARLWVSDHLLLNKDAVATDCLEAWTVLAGLARDTEGIRIGPMVSCQSYRNPALLAKMAAGVDRMSGGRLEFGIGAGWKEVEYRAYGYDYPSDGTRVSQLVETIEICTRLWRDERATYHGRHYHVADAVCAPKPEQSPLPIWIGGSKPRVMRVAARYAAWFNMTILAGPLEDRIALMRDGLSRACAAVKRDPATLRRSLFVQAYVAATRAEADEIVGDLASRMKVTPKDFRDARPGAIFGTPDEAGERFRRVAEAGIDHANVMFAYGHELEGVRALSEVARA